MTGCCNFGGGRLLDGASPFNDINAVDATIRLATSGES